MKPKLLAVVSASLSLILAAMMASRALAAPDPFIGSWHSIDIADGSNQTLNIGGADGHFRVRLYDDGASTCGLDEFNDPLYAAFAVGPFSESGAIVTGDLSLNGDLTLICRSMPASFQGPYAVSYAYDAGTDTLLDNFGTTWYRGH